MTTTPTTREEVHGMACVDCLMLIANGDTSGNSRCETEEGEAEYLADVAREAEGLVAPGWHYACPEDCEGEFTYTGCDVCGDGLGGEKHPVIGYLA